MPDVTVPFPTCFCLPSQCTVVVANLAPRKLRGLESKGMILFAYDINDGGESLAFVTTDAGDGNAVT